MGCTSSSCSKSYTAFLLSSNESRKKGDIRDVYRIGKLLGSGAFGQVRECTRREDGEIFAVKIMERHSREIGHWSNENMFRREVQLLGILDNPHIVQYIDFYEDRHFLYAVIERCDGGELFERIIELKRFSEDDAACICSQMLEALAYVHSINIVHRDVKAENFLFKNKEVESDLKLIDFGMSARLSDDNTYFHEICGSPHYLSPEVIKRRYNTKADMWALGVLIYLLIYGRYPFDGNGTDVIIKQILKKPIEYRAANVVVSSDCIDFMSTLLEREPQKRASAKQALKHKWIAKNAADRQRRKLASTIAAGAAHDLIHCVRSAHRKVTMRRSKGFSKRAEGRLNHLLEKAERQWAEGKACGVRVSPLNQLPNIKPEFSRADKRMNTTPSRYVRGSLADLQALRRAIKQEQPQNQISPEPTTSNLHVNLKDTQNENAYDDDGVTGSTAARTDAMSGNEGPERSDSGRSESISQRTNGENSGERHHLTTKFKENFDWDTAEKAIERRCVMSEDEVFARGGRRTVTVSVNQKDSVSAACCAVKEFQQASQHSKQSNYP